MSERMKPADREKSILEAALAAAKRCGFANVRQKDIAEEAGCSFGLVSRYYSTMNQMRRAIMRAAIKRDDIALVAQGLGVRDETALKAPKEMRHRAVALLVR